MSDGGAAAEVVERELDLRAETPFANTDAELSHLLAIARHAEFHDGDRLFESGGPISNVFLITHGEVELVLEGAPSWRFVGSGGIGFLDLMMGRPHSRTAIARGELRTLQIDAADYRDYLQDHSDVTQRVLSKICHDLLEGIIGSPEAAQLLARATDPNPVEIDKPMLIDRLLILARVPSLSKATVQGLANLAENARIVRFSAGDVISPAGVVSDMVSILVRGEVELTRADSSVLARRGGIDFLAQVAELSSTPRLVAARAATDVIALQIDREDFQDRFDEHFELVQSLFAYLAIEREALNNVTAAAGRDL